MSILRVYDPPECDERGVPLDWERCGCNDSRPVSGMVRVCAVCDDHGSLKAAALAERWERYCRERAPAEGFVVFLRAMLNGPVRCESCSHPMSEGTWENPVRPDSGLSVLDDIAMRELLARPFGDGFHAWAERQGVAHYSPCDEGCSHGGPGRVHLGRPAAARLVNDLPMAPRDATAGRIEASWRPVDVRTLGWPHDLRPEKLAVLCLRCWAAR